MVRETKYNALTPTAALCLFLFNSEPNISYWITSCNNQPGSVLYTLLLHIIHELPSCLVTGCTLLHGKYNFPVDLDVASLSLPSVQCSEYSRGEVYGSLCEPLCSGKEIHFQKCFGGHKQKGLVVQVNWNGESVVLKTFRNLSPSDVAARPIWRKYIGEMDGDGDKWTMELTRSQFIERANATLFYGMFGRRDAHAQTLELLNNILGECDVHNDGVLKDSEAHTCWRAVTTEEYVLYTLFKGEDYMLRTRGVCGDVFAVDFVSSIASHDVLGYKSYLTDQKPWKYRAKLGIALLDMIAFFDNTSYGTLHTCDVKETNYGVSKVDGRMVAKASDLDHSWFGETVSTMSFDQMVFNHRCKTDSDCLFINACYVKCTAGRCSNKLISNNIQVRLNCWVNSKSE